MSHTGHATRPPRWRLAATVSFLVLTACGEYDSATTPSALGPQHGGERLAPEEILASAPIQVGLGPFSGDDTAVWITDFESLARFDVDSSKWSTIDLPYPSERLDGVAFLSNGDGTAAVLLEVCEETCDDDTPFSLRAYHANAEKLIEVPGVEVIATGDVRSIGTSSHGAHFEITNTAGDTLLITVTAATATVADTGRHLAPLCITTDGLAVGVEVDTSAGAPVRTVVAGDAAETLQRVKVPAGAAELLDELEISASAVCTHDHLAIIGPDRGWEMTPAGAITEVASEVTVPPERGQHQIAPAVTTDGVTWVAATGVNLRRDDRGWRAAEERPGDMTAARDTGYAVVGGVLLAYPPGDEPAGAPSVEQHKSG